MTAARYVGFVLVLAQMSVLVVVLGPLLWRYRAVCREWADLTAQVDAARADFDTDSHIEQWEAEMST